MTEEETAYPGFWDPTRSPYLDLFTDTPADRLGPTITVFRKPAQIGASEAIRNLIRHIAHNDPGPMLLVYPDVDTAKSQFVERLVPLFKRDELLLRFNRSEGVISVFLATMNIYITWASSAARLASRPIRYVIIDEADKIRFAKTSREQGPIALAIARTRTYKELARIVIVSTPSIRQAPITEELEKCDYVNHWKIPCAKCAHRFYPSWDCIEWEPRVEGENDVQWSTRIAREKFAFLVCPSCQHRHTEAERQSCCDGGSWVPEDPVVEPRRVGFQINVIGTKWCNIYDLAAKWITVHTDPIALQEFVNQDLGEVYEQKSSALNSSRLKDFIRPDYKLRSMPSWVGQLIAAADSQRDGWYWAVRGFGADKRSLLIDYGFAPTLDHLKACTLDRAYGFSDGPGALFPSTMAIDARGSVEITELVLKWSLTDSRIRPIMGVGKVTERGGAPVKEVPWQHVLNHGSHVTYVGGKRYSVDSNYFKDLLLAHIHQGKWLLPSDVKDDFLMHFNAESKVRQVKNGVISWIWRKKSERAPNHYFDCYDERTEVLTDEGFKFFKDLSRTERLATVCLNTDELTYQFPTAYIDRVYVGPMIKIGGNKGQRTDMLVTPRHRMVVKSGQGATQWTVKRAEDLTVWDKLKTKATWVGETAVPESWRFDIDPIDFEPLQDSRNNQLFSTVEYSGRVYCATVPNGTLVVRRNGKVVVSGNCEAYMEAIAWHFRLELIPNEELLARQRSNNYAVELTEGGGEKWIEGFSQ